MSTVSEMPSFLHSGSYLSVQSKSIETPSITSNLDSQPKKLQKYENFHASSSYVQSFGVPLHPYTMITAILFVPSSANDYYALCDKVMLSLSHYSIFCQLSVYNRDDLSCIIDNVYCDICIVYSELLNIVSQTYPNLCCSVFEYQYVHVRSPAHFHIDWIRVWVHVSSHIQYPSYLLEKCSKFKETDTL